MRRGVRPDDRQIIIALRRDQVFVVEPLVLEFGTMDARFSERPCDARSRGMRGDKQPGDRIGNQSRDEIPDRRNASDQLITAISSWQFKIFRNLHDGGDKAIAAATVAE